MFLISFWKLWYSNLGWSSRMRFLVLLQICYFLHCSYWFAKNLQYFFYVYVDSNVGVFFQFGTSSRKFNSYKRSLNTLKSSQDFISTFNFENLTWFVVSIIILELGFSNSIFRNSKPIFSFLTFILENGK